MTKLFAITSTITALWQSPVIALLILVSLVFIANLLNQYLENQKITCTTTDFSSWSYRDIQLFAIANGISGNQKKVTLIQLLQEV